MNCRYLGRLSTILPGVVIHPTSGALVFLFSLIDCGLFHFWVSVGPNGPFYFPLLPCHLPFFLYPPFRRLLLLVLRFFLSRISGFGFFVGTDDSLSWAFRFSVVGNLRVLLLVDFFVP